MGGAVIQWLRDELRMIQRAATPNTTPGRCRTTAASTSCPAFTGLGAPYWDMYARGAIVGITRGTTQNHIIRAAAGVHRLPERRPCGRHGNGHRRAHHLPEGGRRCFPRPVPDAVPGRHPEQEPVLRPAIRETTALGAAYLAGLATGVWKDRDEIRSLWHCNMTFTPAIHNPIRSVRLARRLLTVHSGQFVAQAAQGQRGAQQINDQQNGKDPQQNMRKPGGYQLVQTHQQRHQPLDGYQAQGTQTTEAERQMYPSRFHLRSE